MPVKKEAIPEKLRPFVALGFDQNGWSGQEAYGGCIFCGKPKMYINSETGQWRCMAGACDRSGNEYSVMTDYYEMHLENVAKAPWAALATNRGLPESVLRNSGIVHDGHQWVLPVRAPDGKIINLRFYKPGPTAKFMGLPTMGIGLYGAEKLNDDPNTPVHLCEGEWDAIATQWMLDEAGEDALALGSPGAEAFKTLWAQWLSRRDITLAYDKDAAGLKGTRRVCQTMATRGCKMKWVEWPEAIPDGYDMRDFVGRDGGTYELYQKMVKPWSDPDAKSTGSSAGPAGKDGKPSTAPEVPKRAIDDPSRPTMSQVMDVYRKWLFMTDDMVDMVRLCYAVVIGQPIPGCPVWMHVAGPPGSGKTEILLSLRNLSSTNFASTIGPHSLVSGFQGQGGSDPSLIPQLDQKTFVLKDFTEVLKMPPMTKAEVYSVLRGAFDGEVDRPFGNGLLRHYEVSFNMLSGVTQDIFAESGASVGERFLIYHLIKGAGWTADEAIMAAITNVEGNTEMKQELAAIASQFLEVTVSREQIKQASMSPSIARRVVGLAQLVAMLRATVQRDQRSGNVMYRPQHEVATRLGVQFTKLLKGLALCEYPSVVTDEHYNLLVRVALDTCIGFNLDIVQMLSKNPGLTTHELADRCAIPITTLTDRMRDMEMLNVLRKERSDVGVGRNGQPPFQYFMSNVVATHWVQAEVEKHEQALLSATARRAESLLPGVRQYRAKRKVQVTKLSS